MPACSVGSRHSSPLSLPPSSTPSEHRRRHRAASDQSESGCDELDGEPAPKKPRSHEVKLNLLMRDVKRYVRTDYPFLKFSPIFQAALHYTPLFEGLKENESLDFENERSEAMWSRWLSLKQGIPSLEDVLIESATLPSSFTSLVKALDRAVGVARSDDTKLLRNAVVGWLGVYRDSRRLSAKVKSDRGFRNSVTGAFLCPVHVKWLEDDAETAALRDHRLRPTAHEWPNLLYSHQTDGVDDDNNNNDDARYLPTPTWDFNPSQPWKGFLRGHLLLKAWAYLFGGSASIGDDGCPITIGRHTDFMKGVTRASIAYAAMQLRHALNNEERFVVEPKGSQFDNPTFYHKILELIEEPNWKNEVSDVLRFYNHKFFPQLKDDGTERPLGSTLNFFDAALVVRNNGALSVGASNDGDEESE